MLQRNSAPMPLNLASTAHATEQVASEPKVGVQRIDELPLPQQSYKPKPQQPQPPQQTPPKVHRPIFSTNFSFEGANPSPPPSAGLPSQPRQRGQRSKSPSSKRNSMLVQDEESEWDMTKLLPQFQHTVRRPSLLTPPNTSDSRRPSYDEATHLGYDDGSVDLLPPGRRSSVPTHHLRPEPVQDRHHHTGFRRSSLATTSITRQDMEDENKHHVETVSEVDSGEEDLAADNVDVEGVQAKTAEMNLNDGKPKGSLKRESEEDSEPNIHSPANTPMPNPFQSLNDVPYPYIIKRLMDLGPYFVGHDATAQAFVQAVPMSDKNPLYKVEIVPRDNKSETFRIVKRCKYDDSDSENSDNTSIPPDSPVHLNSFDDEVEYTSPSLPVHVEYAVFRLPLLGSMLLSGQVSCGDTLKMPLPHPEVWTAVVGWMYTSKVVRLPGFEVKEQAQMVRECIEFLGGRV
jgi:hypothetical protein